MLRLTITGNRFQVARACADRGIPAALKREDGHGGTCDVEAGHNFIETARAWQREEPQAPPYPIGSCLCIHVFPTTGILGSRG